MCIHLSLKEINCCAISVTFSLSVRPLWMCKVIAWLSLSWVIVDLKYVLILLIVENVLSAILQGWGGWAPYSTKLGGYSPPSPPLFLSLCIHIQCMYMYIHVYICIHAHVYNNNKQVYTCTCKLMYMHVCVCLYVTMNHVQELWNTNVHDVIRDVERKKERKKERHLRQWKNEKWELPQVHVNVWSLVKRSKV